MDGDCSHEIKRCLLLGRKVMTNLDSILKNRDIILPTKICLVKAMVFPVVMYGYESWTIKKAECQRIDVFELWCWRRLLRVPWTDIQPVHPKGNQTWIFIGRTDVETETPILWPPDVKSWLTRRDPDAGTWAWANSERWWGTGRPGVLQSMGSQLDTTWQLNSSSEAQGWACAYLPSLHILCWGVCSDLFPF